MQAGCWIRRQNVSVRVRTLTLLHYYTITLLHQHSGECPTVLDQLWTYLLLPTSQGLLENRLSILICGNIVIMQFNDQHLRAYGSRPVSTHSSVGTIDSGHFATFHCTLGLTSSISGVQTVTVATFAVAAQPPEARNIQSHELRQAKNSYIS